jgi:hypothetical protein
MMNVNSARQSAQDVESTKENGTFVISNPARIKKSRSRAAKLLEQPPSPVDYGEANCQTNKDYDWTPEKEPLYQNGYQTLA